MPITLPITLPITPAKPSANLRIAAAQAIEAVCAAGVSLDAAIEAQSAALASRELGQFNALCYGATRWILYYQPQIDQQLKKPFKRKDQRLNYLLVVALFELEHMHTAAHAVVNETVAATESLKRGWAKGLVNALLRHFLRELEGRERGAPLGIKQARQCYPDWLLKQIQQQWPAHSDALLVASMQHPPLTLRVNRRQTTRQAMLSRLETAGISAVKCADSEWGITLKTPLPVSKIPGFAAGLVSVQDESAQLCAALLTLDKGQQVLDACAAPGGKTGLIFETNNALGGVTAVDFQHRLPRLHENMQRLGFAPKVISLDKVGLDKVGLGKVGGLRKHTADATVDATANGAAWWDGQLFARILLDAPCTGSGVMRRHPDIKLRRSPQNSLQFAKQQSQLLQQCWAMLATKGRLLYTTCSILAMENDQQISAFLSAHADARCCPLPDYLGMPMAAGRQRLPGVHHGDGFYYSLLEKI